MFPLTVGIIVKPKHEKAKEALKQLIDFLEKEKISYIFDSGSSDLIKKDAPTVEKILLPKKCDLIVVLGGDGTLLSIARFIPPLTIPIIGVNLGRVGFLTEISVDEMVDVLKLYLNGNCPTQKRMMLNATIIRENSEIASYHCLNDAVITKSALARIIQMKVYAVSGLVADVFADGIIVSTPTGSTAYNLAANGPIVMPQIEAIILNPLCPQRLSLRPIVLPSEEIIEITILGNVSEVYLTADGQIGNPLLPFDKIIVKKSPYFINLIGHPQKSYFSLLSEKLGWAKN